MKFFDFHSDRSRRGDAGMVRSPDSSATNRDTNGTCANSRVNRDPDRTGSVFTSALAAQATCRPMKRLGSGCRKREPLIVRVVVAVDRDLTGRAFPLLPSGVVAPRFPPAP